MSNPLTRDAGLQAAIAVVGGIGALARLLGLSQPSVSIWKRVPPHRVIQVEALTGLSRRILRPDLYDVPEPFTANAQRSTSVRAYRRNSSALSAQDPD